MTGSSGNERQPSASLHQTSSRTANPRAEASLFGCSLLAVDHVDPLLHHVPALLRILGLVLDRAYALLFVRQARLDPVTVEACLVQQR